uniref:Uncharacterized protein n=1 Tax=Anopheles maculatus TaxID=74869 RepID=A0A182SC35_9DIPT
MQAINNVLKERHEIESNYKNLALKFKEMQEEEALRRAKFDEARKKQLAELQAKGEALCREKAKLQHQIEHVTWHLEGCRRRRPCLARLPENCPLKGDAPSCLPHSPEKLKIMANMKSTADHLVRGIMDLRKKIHIVQDKLEHEVAVSPHEMFDFQCLYLTCWYDAVVAAQERDGEKAGRTEEGDLPP